jgi:hypothetical protein
VRNTIANGDSDSGEPDCDTHSYRNCDSNGYSYGNDSTSSDGHAYSDGATADNTYTTASSHTAASPVSADSQVIGEK